MQETNVKSLVKLHAASNSNWHL